MTIIHLLPEIDQAIWNKVGDHEAGKKPKAERGRHHSGATIPAETILAMRRMHEIERKTHCEVAQAFAQFPKQYVRNVLDYIVRGNLRVAR